ncbi:MAG: FecR domain-containing protein [Candidatus Sericytochromatia bacterium]
MKKSVSLLKSSVTLISASLVFSATSAFAQTSGNIQRDAMIVRVATGDSEKKLSSGEWVPIATGSDLSNNDVIKTGKNSNILLELPENAGYIRVLPETEIKVSQIKVDKTFEGGQIAELSLIKGKVITKVRKFNRKSSKFQINTRGATAAVRGTSFVTSFNNNSNETKVTVGDGRVSVKAQNEEVLINEKQYTKIALGGKPSQASETDSDFLFKLDKLEARNNKLTVSGLADPEIEVNINNTSLFANSDGSFTGETSVKEGVNNIAIKAITIDGKTKTSNVKIIKFTE